jgi:hypothetical protein
MPAFARSLAFVGVLMLAGVMSAAHSHNMSVVLVMFHVKH